MDNLEALLLGLLQGLTEYLPVSSSGHLTIGSALFGIEAEENMMFTVAVHVATVLSTLVVLGGEILKIFKGSFHPLGPGKGLARLNEDQRYVLNILVSMIPIGIVGVFFKDQVEEIFGSGLLVVGCCLLATAALLTFSYYAKPRQRENISLGHAFIIGLGQALAVLPGLSRSGTTIATGLILGNKKSRMAQFSFLMVIPPILGEALLDMIKFMGQDSSEQVSVGFVPMLVGFGCSVPAIMATRTLESKRDRFLSVFMTPFMSCGAKLPVWVLFAAAFTPEHPGKLVFLMYATGIVLGIITGLILKHTLFQGEPSHFIMELPPYHMPRPRHIFFHTWERLKVFIFRAGKFIVPMVLVLGLLNSIGTDGSIGKEHTDESLLSVAGKAITPVFEPIGVERENWPASVAIFTGLFAKESVIGTMKGLYGQIDAAAGEGSDGGDGANEAEAVEEYSLIGGLKDAVASIGENLSGVWHGFVDPLGMQDAQDEAAGEEGAEVGNGAIGSLRRHFPKGFHQVFSFLLFILLYVPCLAATGVVFREIGKFYGAVFVGYLTVLGWSVATVYHAVMVSGSTLWLFIGLSAIAAMFVAFYFYGRRHKVDMI